MTSGVIRLLLILVAANTVASHLCRKRGVTQLSGLHSHADIPRLIQMAMTSPSTTLSVCPQVIGYGIWMVVVTRKKLVTTVARCWQTLTQLCSLGIVLGVICLSTHVSKG